MYDLFSFSTTFVTHFLYNIFQNFKNVIHGLNEP